MKFDNQGTKRYLAKNGPTKVFGRDVDKREKLSASEAERWFDGIWEASLRRAVESASECDLDFVLEKLFESAKGFVNREAMHRQFTFANCQFIAQLVDPKTCHQLWFIPSASADPRILYVKFESVPIRDAFDTIANKLGWEHSEELAEKLLLDFMESVNRKSYRDVSSSNSF